MGTERAGRISELPCDLRWDHMLFPVALPGVKTGCISNCAGLKVGWIKKSKIPSAQLRWLVRHFRYGRVVVV